MQEVPDETGQVHARLLSGAVEISRGEGRAPVIAEQVGHHGGCPLSPGTVENRGGEGGGLEVEGIHGALRILLYVHVGQRASQHGIPDAGPVGDALDDAAGHRVPAACELAGKPSLHHVGDRPAELPVEQVGREVRLAAVHQTVHEVVAQRFERQGLGAAGARLVEEQVANAADLHVAAGEVGAEELLQPVGLCSRQPAVLVLEPLRVAEPELEAGGRQTAFTEQQHAGRCALGVHAPAPAIGAERPGNFDQRELTVGVGQAEFAGRGETLGGYGFDLLPGVGEEVQVPQVAGVDQEFDLGALDFRRSAVEPAGDEHDLGHRTGRREALAIAARLRLARPCDRPAGRCADIEVEFEEVPGTLPGVIDAYRRSGAREPCERSGKCDEVAFNEAVQVAENDDLGVLPFDRVEVDCRIEIGEAEVGPPLGAYPDTCGLAWRRRRTEVDVEQAVVVAEGKCRAARVPDAVHLETRIQAEHGGGGVRRRELDFEVEGQTPAAFEVDRAADRLKVDDGLGTALLMGRAPGVALRELARVPGDRREDESRAGQQPGAAGHAPGPPLRVVETGMDGDRGRQQAGAEQGEAAPVQQIDAGPDLGRHVGDAADEAAAERQRGQDVDRYLETQEGGSHRQADARQGGDQAVVADQGNDLHEGDVDGERGQRLDQEVGPHGTPDRRFADPPAEGDSRVAEALNDDHGDDRHAPDHEQGAEEAAEHEFGVRVGPAVEHLDHAVAAVAGAQVEGEEDHADAEDQRLPQGGLAEQELGAEGAGGGRVAGRQAVDDPEVPVLEQAEEQRNDREQPEAEKPADGAHLRPGERPDVGKRDQGCASSPVASVADGGSARAVLSCCPKCSSLTRASARPRATMKAR